MAACAAFVLPSKPRPEFVETFGIALAEKRLAGGGPVITTLTGGIGEAVGDHAIIVPVEDPQAIASALDHALLATSDDERTDWAARARDYAMQFDRRVVFDRMFSLTTHTVSATGSGKLGCAEKAEGGVSEGAGRGRVKVGAAGDFEEFAVRGDGCESARRREDRVVAAGGTE